MEEIPNITSDIIERLKKLNINSVYQLAVQSPVELALEYEDTSLNIESASALIANVRKILTAHTNQSGIIKLMIKRKSNQAKIRLCLQTSFMKH